MKKTMLNVFFLFTFFLYALPVMAAVEAEFVDMANESAKRIVGQIISEKQNYNALADFNEDALQIAEDGLPRIFYGKEAANEMLFEIDMKYLPLQVQQEAQSAQTFHVYFPSSGMQFLVSVKNAETLQGFNVFELVKSELKPLMDREQRLLPLQLRIESAKNWFMRNGKIEFELVLVNAGNMNLKVKKISEDSTYCLFNDQPWGSKEPKGPDSVILMPGKEIRKKIKLGGFKEPGTLNVYCSYGLGFKGVKPYSKQTFVIK